jgi:ribosomal protein S18 acetylase RimI-like enzyme
MTGPAVDELVLAGLEHDNLLAIARALGGAVDGAAVEQRDGVLTVLTGLASPIFNRIAVADGSATEQALATAVARARARGDRFMVELRGGIDDRFLPLMDRLGLVGGDPGRRTPAMAWFPLPVVMDVVRPTDLEIRLVQTVADLQRFVAVVAVGFELPRDLAAVIASERVVGLDEATAYVGYRDGQPVATGFGFRTGRTIGVYDIATIESGRGRGYGTAMTARVVTDGAVAGCDVAVLQASPMGLHLYERLGFRTVLEYAAFMEPSPRAVRRQR